MNVVFGSKGKQVVTRNVLPPVLSTGLIALDASAQRSVTVPAASAALGSTVPDVAASRTFGDPLPVSSAGYVIEQFEGFKLQLNGSQLAQLHKGPAPTPGNATCLLFNAFDDRGVSVPVAVGLAVKPVEVMTKKEKKRLGGSDSDSDDDGAAAASDAVDDAPNDLMFFLPVPRDQISTWAVLDDEEMPDAKFRDADSRTLSAVNVGKNDVYFSEGIAPDAQRGFYIRVRDAAQFGDNDDDKATIDGLKGFVVRRVMDSIYESSILSSVDGGVTI